MILPLHITGSRCKSQAVSMLFSFLVPSLVRFVVLLLVFHSLRLIYISLLFAALLFSFCPSTLSYNSFVLFFLFLLVLLIVLLSSFPFFIFCVILARDFLLPAFLLTCFSFLVVSILILFRILSNVVLRQ